MTPTHRCPLDEPIGPCGVVPDRFYTAVHEAAHAVTARLLSNFSSGGAWVEIGGNGLTITPSPGCIIRRWTRAGKRFSEDSVTMISIMMLAAGSEAERARYSHCTEDDERDRAEISELLPRLPSYMRSERLVRELTSLFVDVHQETINRVADALAERLALTSAEIDAMMPASWTARAYAPCGGEPYPCQQCSYP